MTKRRIRQQSPSVADAAATPQTASRLHHLLSACVIVGLSLYFGRGWFKPGLPLGDFPGFVQSLWHLKRIVTGVQDFSLWQPNWFCGSSMVLSLPNLFSMIMVLPFTFFGDIAASAKCATLVYMAISGLSMYGFVIHATRSRLAALASGVCYSIHPMHVAFAIRGGHLNFAVFYPFVPLALWCMLACARKPSLPRIAGAATIMFFMVWTDVERAAVTLPFLVVAYAAEAVFAHRDGRASDGERPARRAWVAPLATLAAIVAISVGLSVFHLLPAFIESRYHSLFPEKALIESINYFSLHNPLYLVDRAGALVGALKPYLPGLLTYNSALFYLGIAPLVLGIAGLAVGHKLGLDVRRQATLLLLAALALWIANGPYSIYERSANLLTELLSKRRFEVEHGAALKGVCAAIAVAFAAAAFWAWRRRPAKPSQWHRLLFALAPMLVMVLLFAKPFSILRAIVPIYSHMRNPCWFATIIPSLAVSFAASLPVLIVVRRFRDWRIPAAVCAATIGLLWLDFMPYQRHYLRFYRPEIVKELKAVAEVVRQDKDTFRCIARESYNPVADLISVYADVPLAWSWLNWQSPRGTGKLIFHEMFPKLHRPKTIQQALEIAGMANIKYVLYSLFEGPGPPSLDHLLRRIKTPRFLLCQNKLWQPFVQVRARDGMLMQEGYDFALDWSRPRADRIEITVSVVEPARVVAAESYYPGWRATVNGEPQPIEPERGAFLGVSLPRGKSEVVFEYRPPAYFWIARAISIAVLAALAVVMVVYGIGRARQARERS